MEKDYVLVMMEWALAGLSAVVGALGWFTWNTNGRVTKLEADAVTSATTIGKDGDAQWGVIEDLRKEQSSMGKDVATLKEGQAHMNGMLERLLNFLLHKPGS